MPGRCSWPAQTDTSDDAIGALVAARLERQAILDRADPPDVVQVVPAGNGANAGLAGAFDIAAGDGMPETLRTESVEDQTTEKRSLVRKAAVAFDRVRGEYRSMGLPRAGDRRSLLPGALRMLAHSG